MLKIRIIKEVYSDKQRKYMCAMKEPGADRPDGLSKAEAEEMCSGPMKNEDQLDEISAAGAGGLAGASGGFVDKEEIKKFNEKEKKNSKLSEMYSTSGLKPVLRIKCFPVTICVSLYIITRLYVFVKTYLTFLSP